jgi:hypothetical protein
MDRLTAARQTPRAALLIESDLHAVLDQQIRSLVTPLNATCSEGRTSVLVDGTRCCDFDTPSKLCSKCGHVIASNLCSPGGKDEAMLFVSLLKLKEGTTRQVSTLRRLEWDYPEGVQPIAEYWLQASKPQVIVVTESDSVTPMMSMMSDWDDLYEIAVFPAITAEEGLQLARQMFEQVPA